MSQYFLSFSFLVHPLLFQYSNIPIEAKSRFYNGAYFITSISVPKPLFEPDTIQPVDYIRYKRFFFVAGKHALGETTDPI